MFIMTDLVIRVNFEKCKDKVGVNMKNSTVLKKQGRVWGSRKVYISHELYKNKSIFIIFRFNTFVHVQSFKRHTIFS